MIKRLPGWANYFVLWAIYFIVAVLVDAICYWTQYYPQMHWFLDAFFSAVYAGPYLAKWRFYQKKDGTWDPRFY